MSDVIVYYGNSCTACHEEMEYLNRLSIPYTAKNVSDDQQARKELIGLGSKTVPTTIIDGTVIVGFDLQRIEELLSPETSAKKADPDKDRTGHG